MYIEKSVYMLFPDIKALRIYKRDYLFAWMIRLFNS